jgi:phospholipid/cholesterol/gamma-HCH transport system substrate-binding protein
MEKSKIQLLKLGVFVMTGLALFVLGIYLLGNQQSMFGNTAKIYSLFKDVKGLKVGNNIRFSGYNVGTVKKIEFKTDSTILVTFVVQKDVLARMNKKTEANISTDGLVGNMIINLIYRGQDTHPLVENDTIFAHQSPSTDDMMTILNKTNQNAAHLTTDLLLITDKMVNGHGPIGLLLNDESFSYELKQVLKNANLTINSGNSAVKDLHKIISSLDKSDNVVGMLKDTSISRKIKNTIATLESSASAANNTIDNINSFVEEAKSSNGAVNYLIKDTSLVNRIDHTGAAIDSTTQNLIKTSLLLNENLEALKHNIFFRGYFKKLEKKKKEMPGK